MADKFINLFLRIREDGAAVLKKVQADAQGAAKALGQANAAANASGGSGGGAAANFRSISGAVQDLRANSDALVNSLRNIAIGFVGLQIVQQLKGFADTAARVQSLGTVLNVVAVNAGITEGKIAEVDRQVQKMGITAQSSRQALTAFIQAGLDIDKAAPLARAAQDLAVIAGKNSSQLFQQIVLNIQQLDTVGLRYNGVVLNMEEAQTKFAESIGKTRDQLSQAEKQQAALIGVLEKGREVQGVYEKSLGDVGKQVQSLARYQQEAAVSVGNNLLPTYRVLVEEFTTFLQQSKLVTDQWAEQSDGAQRLANAIRPVAVVLREIGVFLVQHIDLIAALVLSYAGLSILASVITNFVTIGTVALKAAAGLRVLWLALEAGAAAATAAFAANPLLLAFVLAVGVAAQAGIVLWNKYRKAKQDALDAKTAGGLVKETASLEEVEDKLARKLNEQVQLTAKINALKSQQVDADKQGNNERFQELDEEIKKGKEREAQVGREIEALNKLARARGGQGSVARSDQRAKEMAALNAQRKALEGVDKAFQDLQISSSQRAKGLNLSEDFGKQFAAAQRLVDAFSDNLKKFGKDADNAVTLGNLVDGLSKLAEGAKTFDEMREAIRLIAVQAQATGSVVLQNLLDTTKFRAAQAAVNEVKKSLEGYTEAQKRVKEQNDLIFGINQDTQRFANETKKAFAEVGAASAVSATGLVSFYSVIVANLNERNNSLKQEIALFNQTREAAQIRYASEVAAIEDLKNKQVAAINGQIGNEQEKQARLVAIERDTAVQRQAAAKKYYDELRTQQQSLQQAVLDSANKIKQLDDQKLQNSIAKEDALRNLRRQGLSEEQKVQDDLARTSQLNAEFEQDILLRKTEAAKRAADEQLKIAQSIASSATDETQRLRAAQLLEQAYGNQDKVVSELKAQEVERGQALTRQLNDTTQRIDDLSKKIAGMANSIKLDIDTTAFEKTLQELRTKAQTMLSGIPITFTASTTSTPGFADGGIIRGPGTGTSDSVLMWGSNGEAVTRAAAVDYYGEEFMSRINNMTLPKFAQGGIIGGSTNQGGGEQTLNLTFNNRPIGRIRGSRQTVRELTDALSELARGSNA